jgi:hypothetical protein
VSCPRKGAHTPPVEVRDTGCLRPASNFADWLRTQNPSADRASKSEGEAALIMHQEAEPVDQVRVRPE